MRTANFIKASFLSLFLMFSSIFGILATVRLIRHFWTLDPADPMATWFGLDVTNWLGVWLVTMPIVLTIGAWMLRAKTARTSAKLPYHYTLALFGFALTMIPVWGGPIEIGVPHIGATVGLVMVLLYIHWYSDLERIKSAVLDVGKKMPVFEALTPDGQVFSTASLSNRKAIYLFFRGNWCPLCMAQIKEIATGYRQLAAKGVEVVLISPQPDRETRKLAARYDVPFHFLTDKEGAAARALGIFSPGGLPAGLQLLGYSSDTVLPTVIATDDRGEIVFVDQTDNYRVRPEPETFFALYDA